MSFRRINLSVSQPSQETSLFEELFPEEVRKDGDQDTKFYYHAQEVPRLPLPEVDDFLDGFGPKTIRETSKPQRVTKAAAANAFRQEQVAVLSLETGSKSLVESDFRRIAPKGQHIGHWTGPGDILKSEFKKRERHFYIFIRANLFHSHPCARPYHVRTDRSLLCIIRQSRVRSNLSRPYPPFAPDG